MYRVKVRDNFGEVLDETYWSEQKKAQREFDSVKDHMSNNDGRDKVIDAVDLHELEVDNGNGTDHKLIDSHRAPSDNDHFWWTGGLTIGKQPL